MTLKLFNTLNREKEIFEPIQPGRVGVYLCGPTVYKPAHIGHAVGPVIIDALKRFLSFKGYKVTLVVNITDVDDKLIVEAQSRGITMEELAEATTASYLRCMNRLGVTSIDFMPRATQHIEEIVTLIDRLVSGGAAYTADGDVYFDISASKEYGKLSNRKAEDQEAGGRALASTGKKNQGDFALWKSAKAGEPAWDSPWGKGRPGWHIECSAMSMKYLGESFDIHAGGMDLIFPHHENEIVQSETATGKIFSKVWLHNGLTRMKTKGGAADKMSKSLGNVRELESVLDDYGADTIRFFILSTHYRRPIDFSEEAVSAVRKGLNGLHRLFDRVERVSRKNPFDDLTPLDRVEVENISDARQSFINDTFDLKLAYLESLDDDFNTAGAIGHLYELSNRINRFIDDEQLEKSDDRDAMSILLGGTATFIELGGLIGLFERQPTGGGAQAETDQIVDKLMEILIQCRADARTRKDFAQADSIRDRLAEVGVSLEDRPGETGWRRDK
jgi:cysteinyl-tRNA synthetase